MARIFPSAEKALGFQNCFFCSSDFSRFWTTKVVTTIFQPNMRTTNRTCHRLCVKPSIRWVGVFAFAIGAHWEVRHRGFWAVVGNVFDDGEARSAVGAVDEGITIAAVVWVEAFRAGSRDKWKHQARWAGSAPSTDSEWRMSKEVNPLAGRKDAENSSMRESAWGFVP